MVNFSPMCPQKLLQVGDPWGCFVRWPRWDSWIPGWDSWIPGWDSWIPGWDSWIPGG